MEQKIKSEKKQKTSSKEYTSAVGRRREAVARVRLYTTAVNIPLIPSDVTPVKGDTFVNGLKIDKYFGGSVAKALYERAFQATGTGSKFVTSIRVAGGGKSGQLDAVVHGIARALSIFDKEKHHVVLRKKGFLTRDARIRQRRTIGTGGKSRRKKQSPKR